MRQSLIRGREAELRTRLEAALASDVVGTLLELVDERVEAALGEARESGPWLTVEEAAAHLRVSERTLQRRIKSGSIRSTTFGRRRLLHRDHLEGLAATEEDVAPTTPPRRRSG